jgi:TolB protein
MLKRPMISLQYSFVAALLCLVMTSEFCKAESDGAAAAPAVSSGSAPAPAASGDGSIYIKVGDAKLKKSLMAIPLFQQTGSGGSSKTTKLGKEFFDTFSKDMEISNLFEFVKPGAFLEDTTKVGLKPAPGETGGFNYASWKQIGTEFLVRVGYRISGDEVTADTYTYYVPQQKVILGKTYKAEVRDVRTLAHTFANDVVKAVTGERGSFLTKLVVSRSTAPQQKEIFVMDWDASNPHQISNHKTIAQSPTWGADGKSLAYSAFAYHANEHSRNLDLFTYDLTNGKRFLVSYRKGINSGAAFMPDGKNLLLTISNAGNPDIYRMTLDGRKMTRLTTGRTGDLNVEPAPSPDGRKIAFSSNRNDRPHIFVMNSDGTGAKQVTLAGVYNSTPAWSPDGKRIAFAGYESSHFDIFIMDADGTNMARLTSAKKPNGKWANNEDPSFSPDGRNILFRSDRTGKYQLYLVSTDGESEHRLTFDQHEYYKPRWSPFLD